MAQVKTIGSRGQISLCKENAGRPVTVEEIEPGVWLVKSVQIIPQNEMWLHSPEVSQTLELSNRLGGGESSAGVGPERTWPPDWKKAESVLSISEAWRALSSIRITRRFRAAVRHAARRCAQCGLRVTQRIRSVAYRDGNFLRFVSIHGDHDSAYQ